MPTGAVTILPPPAAIARGAAIGGIGELGVPTFAPALANAWFKLSGQRVRTLPFFPTATMSD
jgi:isoquinoline 1-oxidoreductase beta subunit